MTKITLTENTLLIQGQPLNYSDRVSHCLEEPEWDLEAEDRAIKDYQITQEQEHFDQIERAHNAATQIKDHLLAGPQTQDDWRDALIQNCIEYAVNQSFMQPNSAAQMQDNIDCWVRRDQEMLAFIRSEICEQLKFWNLIRDPLVSDDKDHWAYKMVFEDCWTAIYSFFIQHRSCIQAASDNHLARTRMQAIKEASTRADYRQPCA